MFIKLFIEFCLGSHVPNKTTEQKEQLKHVGKCIDIAAKECMMKMQQTLNKQA